MKQKVYECIREINKEKDAQQGIITKKLGISREDLVAILNELHEESRITAGAVIKNKGRDQTLKYLEFGHIKAL